MHEIIYTVEKAFKVISFDKNLFNIRYVKETRDDPHNDETNDVSKMLCKSNRIGDTKKNSHR